MFKAFMDQFFGADVPDLKSDDGQKVLSALLVRVARADGVFDATERKTILSTLQTSFSLSPQEAEALLKAGEELEASAQDTQHFTSSIKASVPLDQRFDIMVSVWRTVLADGTRAPEEDALARLIAPLLGLDDMTSAKARQKVERESK